jgi:hypothetical protein
MNTARKAPMAARALPLALGIGPAALCARIRRGVALLALALGVAAGVGAGVGEAAAQVPSGPAPQAPGWAADWAQAHDVPPKLQGAGTLRFFGLHIYDAKLWVPQAGFEATRFEAFPLALELTYARRLVGKQIAERSLKEMQGLAPLSQAQQQAWLAEMQSLFPDVSEGDRITGLYLPPARARFFVNGAFRGEVKDAEFARAFFGIWLSGRSSEPALRQALLGLGR